jgi:hypothetical protein
MRSDLCPLRSAAVSLFEVIDADPGRPGFRPSRPQLPLYVEPAPGEALLSWLLRLANRLQVSLHTLASYSFGIEDRPGRTRGGVVFILGCSPGSVNVPVSTLLGCDR